MIWHSFELHSPEEILRILETDHGYAAYAIGDLEPGLFEQCQWACACRGDGPESLALHFSGLQVPALFLMGNAEGLEHIFTKLMCPPLVYFTCRAEHLAVTRKFYRWSEAAAMWRMSLNATAHLRGCGCSTVLGLDDLAALRALYHLGGGEAFTVEQLARGVYFGVRRAGELVAAAGTHLVSHTQRLAAIGNVFVHPGHRGQHLGKDCVGAVASELLRQGVREIVLYVRQENDIAIGLYEGLGFGRTCAFLEGEGIRKSSSDPGSGQHTTQLVR